MSRLCRLLVVVAGLAVVLSGCGGGERVPETAAMDTAGGGLPTFELLPLAAGNYWRYKEYSFVGPDTVQTEAASVTSSKLAVVRQVRENGTLYWLANRTWLGQPGGSKELFRHNAQGMLRKWGLGTPAFYAIKAPLVVGTQWQNTTENATMRLGATNATVIVPYGTVTGCLMVEQVSNGDAAFKSRIFYKAGLGIVREVFFNGSTVISRVDLWQTNVTVPAG